MSIGASSGPGKGPDGGRFGRAWTAFTEALALAGGVLLGVVAFLVTVSVLLRWLADEGIAGDFELVQITTALTAFSFLPLCQAARANIIVDSFTARLSQRSRDVLDGLWDAIYAVVALLIAWQLLAGARDTLASGTTSMVRQLPIGYAIAACAAMALVLAITACFTAARLLTRRG